MKRAEIKKSGYRHIRPVSLPINGKQSNANIIFLFKDYK